MLKNLLTLYENSFLCPRHPERPSNHNYYFWCEVENIGIGIPKADISEKEVTLLKTIYQLMELPVTTLNPMLKGWHDFLFLEGPMPHHASSTCFRFIQFQINGTDVNSSEIESALKGFFTEDVLIVWETSSRGVVIEEKQQISLTEEELISMTETFESDFYVKIFFYIGKLHPCSDRLRSSFLEEKDYFLFALKRLSLPYIYTFERVFPAYSAYYLPTELKQKASQAIIEVFQDDPDMFSTIKVFLENNLNASLTAKKLYIHRNTLQYRIDKFVEKTGIGIKDFYGAYTVFLACLLYELSHQ